MKITWWYFFRSSLPSRNFCVCINDSWNLDFSDTERKIHYFIMIALYIFCNFLWMNSVYQIMIFTDKKKSDSSKFITLKCHRILVRKLIGYNVANVYAYMYIIDGSKVRFSLKLRLRKVSRSCLVEGLRCLSASVEVFFCSLFICGATSEND